MAMAAATAALTSAAAVAVAAPNLAAGEHTLAVAVGPISVAGAHLTSALDRRYPVRRRGRVFTAIGPWRPTRVCFEATARRDKVARFSVDRVTGAQRIGLRLPATCSRNLTPERLYSSRSRPQRTATVAEFGDQK
jgi:hypothetical protein